MRIRTLAALVLLCAALGGRAHAQWVGATGDAAGPPPVDYVLDSWRATGEASESICRFTAELKCRILGRGWVAVPFVGSGVSLASLTVSEGEAAKVLVQAKEGKYQLLFGKQGAYTIKIEYVVRLEKREGERSATVPLIPSVTSTTELTLPAESVSYETKPEVKASKSEAGGKTTIIIYGAEVPETTLTWRVKAKVEEGAALAFAEARLDVTATRGLIRVDEEISYSVLRGKLSRMRVSFPADCSLVSVAAEGLRSWDVAPEGAARSALTVDLATPAEKSATLRIALERQVGRVPAEVDIPDVEVMDVRRESGSVLIFGEKEIKVEAGALEGASQVDVREAKVAQAKRPDLAFKYLKRPCRIAVKLSDVEPKVTAEVETHIVAGRERLRATAAIRYQIRDAGVFRLRIQLDAATQLVDVRGENINNWRRNGDVVEVDLRSKAEESYALTVELARAVAAAGLTELPKLQLLGVERETGFIAISPRQDTKVESASVSGIRQVDATELPASLKRGPEAAVSLAYRYVQHPYRVQLSVGKVQPEVHAKVMNTYTLKEKEFILDASVELEVRKAGIFDLRISFPKELRIEGTVREPDRARRHDAPRHGQPDG